MPDVRSTLTLSVNGALTVGTGKDRWIAPFAGDVVNVTAVVGTAPTGASLILDVKKETGAPGTGTSIFTTPANRPTIPSGAFESPVGPTPNVAQAHFVAGDVLVLDVIQVGSTVAGTDADVVVQFVVA